MWLQTKADVWGTQHTLPSVSQESLHFAQYFSHELTQRRQPHLTQSQLLTSVSPLFTDTGVEMGGGAPGRQHMIHREDSPLPPPEHGCVCRDIRTCGAGLPPPWMADVRRGSPEQSTTAHPRFPVNVINLS